MYVFLDYVFMYLYLRGVCELGPSNAWLRSFCMIATTQSMSMIEGTLEQGRSHGYNWSWPYHNFTLHKYNWLFRWKTFPTFCHGSSSLLFSLHFPASLWSVAIGLIFVVVAVLPQCWRVSLICWVGWSLSLPQRPDSNFHSFFAVDTPSCRLDLRYWYISLECAGPHQHNQWRI